MTSKKKIVIVGGGFAGLNIAKKLRNTNYDVTLIDKHNYHQFQPLFYQVASARIEPSSISFPFRKFFQGSKNITFRMGEVTSIDTLNKVVYTFGNEYPYDILILSTGCTTNFFGNKNIEEHSLPMKTTTEAMALRNHILLSFEKALHEHGEEEQALLTFVVVGGGPTGVEMAGALAEMKTRVLPKDYPDRDFSKIKIYLLEGGPATLGPMSKASQEKSKEYLEQLGVDVRVNAIMEEYDGKVASMKDGSAILTRNLIWAAGVTGNIPKGVNPDLIQRGNRIKVNRFNQVEEFDDIFVLGDVAYMETPKYPKGHPQVANVAINQAKNLARNLKKGLEKSSWQEFEYKDQGSMATVGKRKAVVDLPSLSFQGRFAWLFWMFLHLMLILSAKNKLFIFINWMISYFTGDTTLRLILLSNKKQEEQVQDLKQL